MNSTPIPTASSGEKKQYAARRWEAAVCLLTAIPQRQHKAQAAAKPKTILLPGNLENAVEALAKVAFSREQGVVAEPKNAPDSIRAPLKLRPPVLSDQEKREKLDAKKARRDQRIAQDKRICREILDLPLRKGTRPQLSRLCREREKLAFGHELNPSGEASAITARALAASELEDLLHDCMRYVPVLDREADFKMALKRLLPIFRRLKRRLSKVDVHTLRTEAEAVQLELAF